MTIVSDYINYVAQMGVALCRQILLRSYVFLGLDIFIFLLHAAFLTADMGGFGGLVTTAPSFLHLCFHFLSFALIFACMFLQFNIHNTILKYTSLSSLRVTFASLLDAFKTNDKDKVTMTIGSKITEGLLELEDATAKASRYLYIIEFFTCAVFCLLFLIPVTY